MNKFELFLLISAGCRVVTPERDPLSNRNRGVCVDPSTPKYRFLVPHPSYLPVSDSLL